MEITKKGIPIMTTLILASTIQEPIFIVGAIIFFGVVLMHKGGEIRKF